MPELRIPYDEQIEFRPPVVWRSRMFWADFYTRIWILSKLLESGFDLDGPYEKYEELETKTIVFTQREVIQGA